MSPLLTVDEIVRCALTAGLKFLISGEMNKCVSAESIPPSSGTERNFESLIRNVLSLVCKNVSRHGNAGCKGWQHHRERRSIAD